MQKDLLLNYTPSEMQAFVEASGQPRYRTKQLLEWLYRSKVASYDEMTNLPKAWRKDLARKADVNPFPSFSVQESSDSTRKYLFTLRDGQAIESVCIPMKEHFTLCLSTQVGCALHCAFCLTGKLGFRRNLQAGEILGQILAVQRELPETESRISNIVFMGMGEALLNYDETVKAIRLMLSEQGLNFSNRRITLSTAGLVPELQRLGQEDFHINLAISLNAPDNELRSQLMPINTRYPLEQLLNACREYPLPERRRITFEYILLDRINDSLDHADRLAHQLRGIRCKINLIPYNAGSATYFRASEEAKILAFQAQLLHHGYATFIRASKGADISAACGQLSGERQRMENM
ncbi:23S rRNA (adenine(2503)-C(2))-methyltransferase RlmN [candidate division KSB3 bacterium]|uniref:Probable dual-specificity RNA methyltransferase RlmN n=1 Tax=candidate division KSB3 bacterium TaxID=2044937 RepID=A0A2G6E0Q5_9BACT|nr:MAG: 23S rRNA (adenine(2503)-C(2))-methyltransferase RlmN [candidate division KSB3 bacterium]PIE28354.1 MAG: 23S rRNA (adenine(2503)-C(2))-methyltransferase RlmN [candidate division KSB3 bacterium]